MKPNQQKASGPRQQKNFKSSTLPCKKIITMRRNSCKKYRPQLGKSKYKTFTIVENETVQKIGKLIKILPVTILKHL